MRVCVVLECVQKAVQNLLQLRACCELTTYYHGRICNKLTFRLKALVSGLESILHGNIVSNAFTSKIFVHDAAPNRQENMTFQALMKLAFPKTLRVPSI